VLFAETAIELSDRAPLIAAINIRDRLLERGDSTREFVARWLPLSPEVNSFLRTERGLACCNPLAQEAVEVLELGNAVDWHHINLLPSACSL
jgi:hypothetical protein